MINEQTNEARIPQLPGDFFEQLLLMEMKMVNDDSNAVIQLAIQYYTYYNDRRAKDYQIRMGNLLTKKNIMKSFSAHKKDNSSHNFIDDESDKGSVSLSSRKNANKKKSKLKQKVKTKFTAINATISESFDIIITNKKKNEVKLPELNQLIKGEFSKQHSQWQQKLLLKNKINKAKSNYNSPKIQPRKNHSTKSCLPIIRVSSCDSNEISAIGRGKNTYDALPKNTNPLNDTNRVETLNEYKDDSQFVNEDNNVIDHDDIIDQTTKTNSPSINPDAVFYNKLQIKLEAFDDLINHNVDNNINSQEDKEFDLSTIPWKFQPTFSEIEKSINDYIQNFNTYHFENPFQLFYNEMKKITEEKHDQFINISETYRAQIKKHEKALHDHHDNVNEMKDIMLIIKGLKEEEQHEQEKIEDKYNTKLRETMVDFKQKSLKNTREFEIIDEKIKLDIYTIINNSIDYCYHKQL